jgi:ubiquinone/menaquinone biosynthesis C-methylase UbiE
MGGKGPGWVDYDQIAADYDRRYQENRLQGVGAALHRLASEIDARRILEVGCGTGQWLTVLQGPGRSVWGVDRSLAMLAEAWRRAAGRVAHGRAEALPLPGGSFELVFSVNAIHHFDDPRRFVHEAARLLRPRGALATIGIDPHTRNNRWYLYDYFPGTLETDLRRFPAHQTVGEWMRAAGLESIRTRQVERILDEHIGSEVLDNPFLEKGSNSQLALLSDDDYAAGIATIRAAVRQAEAAGETLRFAVDLALIMVTGRRS